MMVRLRPWREDDAGDCAKAGNDPVIQQFLPLLPRPYTSENALEFFGSGRRDLAVADPVTDRVLGAVGLSERGETVGAVGFWVAPWARRRGVARSAVEAFSETLFKEGYQRLVMQTAIANSAGQRTAIAAGFTREGIARAAGRDRDNSRHDMVVWARIIGDPPGPSRRLVPDLPDGGLTDGTIVVRPLGPPDAAGMAAMRTSPAGTARPSARPPQDATRFERLCAEADAGWLAGERAAMTIRTAADEFAGEIALFDFNHQMREATIGFRVLPEFRGRGYASRAARLVSDWAYTIGTHRVVAGTEPDNVASQRVLEAAGFEREGVQLGRNPKRDGSWADNVQFARRDPADL
jgi:RimJ/RimL family protein N-acetyltransferase